MRLTASEFYTLYRPSRCGLRVFLRNQKEPEGKPSPYEEVVRRLGDRHERAHLETFPKVTDLSDGSLEDRLQRTKESVGHKEDVIYQGVLVASLNLGATECEIVGEPDFLIKSDGGYVIRDSKIARRITEKDHPEIFLQVSLYGWLYEQQFGTPPVRTEVHNGANEIVAVPYDSGSRPLEVLEEIFGLKSACSEPYSPVGWSKCGGCAFNDRCWPAAEKRRDVAMVVGVDQGLATALHEQGIDTPERLLKEFDEGSLGALQRPRGTKMQRVGKRSTEILRMAEALSTGKELILRKPDIPRFSNYVMFDLEGLPPQLDELDKVYLWGMQVFGDNQGEFQPVVAGFGCEGDRQGWLDFLATAEGILSKHGDIPFVHWAVYEKTKLSTYIERFGDPAGIAARIRGNLLDLLPITQQSIALPLPSYSLKVVEKYVGYKRKLEEYGGDWAMAKYIEATEMEDEQARQKVMDQILAYNCEDLEATWAVLQWLTEKA